MEVDMLRTASVSQLRSDLSSPQVEQGPLIVLSRSQPAVLLDPQVYEALIENAEILADILTTPCPGALPAHPEAAVDGRSLHCLSSRDLSLKLLAGIEKDFGGCRLRQRARL
jgi:hypothetical protein